MDNELLKNEAVTLEEIVFEHRNKEYGAYVLRKKFRKFLLIAFLISFFSVGGAVLVPFIQALNNQGKNIALVKSTVVTMENIKANDDIPPPPPPPPPPPAAEVQVKYVAPVVVDSVKTEVEFATVSEAKETVTNVPVPEKVEVVKEAETAIVEEEQVFIVVEEQAAFQGGSVDQFRDWVTKNLKYPTIAIENGISGKVYVQYAVNSKGDVVDVKVVRGVDPSLDKEAVRVIQSSPKWEPAKQRGTKVKQQFTIPIAFQLQ